MTKKELISHIIQKKSFLSIGLDPDLDKIPSEFLQLENPILSFNKAIIDVTRDLCIAYKPNLAFYECFGSKGWEILEQTIQYIGKDHFVIADAKRGDIGNTSNRYAKAFFDNLNCDAITVTPYMGYDSIEPFLKWPQDKWTIVLALTSNSGANDFQKTPMSNGEYLFERVISQTMVWGSDERTMFVVGATQTASIAKIRKMAPNHFFLIPGVGAQGGNLEDVYLAAKNKDIGIIVNASRSIIYAHKQFPNLSFQEAVREATVDLQQQMYRLLKSSGFV
jgi:orotidine-5'-phosphate decarboxylase